MFSKYTILFAILAFFATQNQGAQAAHIESADERSLADLVRNAEEAIARLRQTIRNAVDNAKHRLDEVREAIIAEAEKVLARAEETIKAEVEKVRELIKEMKHNAELVGVDVRECMLDNQDELEQIARNIMEDLKKCIMNEITKAVNIVNEAIKNVMDVKEAIETLPEELKKCMGSSSPVPCIKALIVEVGKDIKELPTKMQVSVSEIIKLVTDFEANMKACAASKILEASRDAATVGAKVAKCVADKIKE